MKDVWFKRLVARLVSQKLLFLQDGGKQRASEGETFEYDLFAKQLPSLKPIIKIMVLFTTIFSNHDYQPPRRRFRRSKNQPTTLAMAIELAS